MHPHLLLLHLASSPNQYLWVWRMWIWWASGSNHAPLWSLDSSFALPKMMKSIPALWWEAWCWIHTSCIGRIVTRKLQPRYNPYATTIHLMHPHLYARSLWVWRMWIWWASRNNHDNSLTKCGDPLQSLDSSVTLLGMMKSIPALWLEDYVWVHHPWCWIHTSCIDQIVIRKLQPRC